MVRRKPDPAGPGLFDSPSASTPGVDPSAGKSGAKEAAADAAAGPKSARRGSASAKTRIEDPSKATPAEPRVWSVGELTATIGAELRALGSVQVEGEISSLKRAASGHVYFDLKDDGGRISCVVWRSRVERAFALKPAEGMQVVAHGKLEVYAPRGSYSLIVERVEQRGIGALLAKLEALKVELRELGRFDRQRPLPAMPERIGVVTSRDTAALRDFLRTRSLRWPSYPVRLCHAPVQGPGSAEAIADAITRLDASGVDVIVVTRGGGSLEDLWAFNERVVADAIWDCSVPVVSAVGHESDVSLSDHVADWRAHTPTDAAQTVIPERAACELQLERAANHLYGAMDDCFERRLEALERIRDARVLRSANWILEDRARALLEARSRLQRAGGRSLERARIGLDLAFSRLERASPRARLERWQAALSAAGARLIAATDRRVATAQARFEVLARSLEITSPLAVLGRGFSIARRTGSSELLRDASGLAVDDEVETQLAKGRFRARITEVIAPEDKGA